MIEELSQEEEKVFQWIAGQASKRRYSIGFSEAMEALDITDAKTLNDILKKLKNNRWSSLAIQDIQCGGMISEKEYFFTVSTHAPGCWHTYEEAKKKAMCPKCEKPDLEVLGPVYRYRCQSCGKEIERVKI